MDEEQQQEELVNFPVSLDPPDPEYNDLQHPLSAETAPATIAGKKYADFKNLDNQLSEETKAVLHKIAQQVHEKMLQKTGVSLAALIEQETKAALPPRPTRLFEDEKPRDEWAYQVQYKIKILRPSDHQPDWCANWCPAIDGRNLHPSRVRALRALDALLAEHPYRADPRTYQWQVAPVYMGVKWRDLVQTKWDRRRRTRAIQKQAREEAMRNAMEEKLRAQEEELARVKLEVDWQLKKEELQKYAEYEVQKLNEGVSEVLGYDVQPYVVMHPKAYDDLIADDKVLG